MRTRSPIRSSIPLLSAFALATSASAQVNVYPLEGPSAGAHAGQCVAALGDLNGDGYDDFAVGAPQEQVGSARPGRVRIYSGKTRTLLRTLSGLADGDQFGRSICAAGDVDLDGTPDLIVGAPLSDFTASDAGRADVYSGATGIVLYSFFGYESGERLGLSVAGNGDVDGDGRPDFATGSPGASVCEAWGSCQSAAGMVTIYSGTTGLALDHELGQVGGLQLGWSIAFVGDTNLDGRDDLAIGIPYAPGQNGVLNVGCAGVYDSASGQWLDIQCGDTANGLYGWSVASAGDMNHDGRGDYAFAAPFRAGFAGRVEVYSGGDRILYHTYDGAAGSMLGTSIANAGDVDGDGRDDLIVGIPLHEVLFAGTYGAARIYSGATGAILEALVGPTQESDFGVSVAGDLDVNRDGVPDALVGADSADVVATNAGRAYVVLADDAAGTLLCLGDGTDTTCPCGNASNASERAGCRNSLGLGAQLAAHGRASVAFDHVVLEASHMPNSSSLFFQGTAQEASGHGVVFGDGLRCAGGTIVRLGTHLNALNRSNYPQAGEQAVSVRGTVPAGSSRYYQVWYRNAAAYCTGSTFNLTNAVRVDWRP